MTTIGNTSVGGAFDNIADNYLWFKLTQTAAGAGTVTSLTFYCRRKTGAAGLSVAIYSDASGHPSNRLATNETGVTVPSTTGWVDVPISLSIAAGDQLWAAVRCNTFGFGNDIEFAETTNGSLAELEFASNSGNANFPTTKPTTTIVTNERASVYLNYTPTAAQTINAPLISSAAQVFGPVLSAAGSVAIPFLATTSALFAPAVTPANISAPLISSTSTTRQPSVGGALAGPGYATFFDLTESPMRESGVWSEGLADGIDWHDVVTAGGVAHGTQSGTEAGSAQYADSIAVLRGTFSPDQTLTSVCSGTTASADFSAEVEHLHRFVLTPHGARGYEVNWSRNGFHGAYCTIVRWNGPLGGFTTLSTTFPGAVVAGDVLTSTCIGTTIRAYINGVLVNTATDSTFSDGNPGIGFYLHNGTGTGNSTSFGLTQFAVVANQNLSAPTVASSSAIFTVGASGTGRIDVPFIGSGAVLLAAAATTIGGESDVGLVANEGTYALTPARQVSHVRLQVEVIRRQVDLKGSIAPVGAMHVGEIGVYQLAPQSDGTVVPFAVWSKFIGHQTETFYVPAEVSGVLADGVFWRLAALNSLHLWVR